MISIRKYQPGDDQLVRELVQTVFAKEFPNEAQAYPLTDLDQIESSYGKLGEAFFVAAQNGRIVGTIGVKREDDRSALLRRFFVASDCRGSGLGSRLADRAIEFCKEVGYDEIVIKTTSSMDRAVQVCQKKGFVSRARIHIGPVELLKLTLFLKSPAVKEKVS